MRIRIVAGPLLVSLAVSAAWAQTPLNNAFTYQGRLNSGGSPANGVFDLRFVLYNVDVGGTQMGSALCANDVIITDGLFTQTLNFGPQFDGDQRFLEIHVRINTGMGCGNPAAFTILSPRQPLTPAPNAIYSINAGRLDGLDSAAFLQSVPVPLTLSGTDPSHIIGGQNASTSVGASGVRGVASAATGATVGVHGESSSTAGVGVSGAASASSGITLGGYFQTNSSAGRGVYGYAGATSGQSYGGIFESRSTGGVGVQGVASATSGLTVGGFFQSNSPTGLGAYGLAGATTGTNYGGYFESRSDTGHGVYGYASATTGGASGGYFQSDGSTGHGVHGVASSTSGTNAGVYGQCDSSSGYGVHGMAPSRGVYGVGSSPAGISYGGYFESAGNAGIGVRGECTSTSDVAPTFGGYFRTSGSSGYGVFGWARSVHGTTAGVYGYNDSDEGRGMHGIAVASSGSTYGGYFESTSTAGVGVYGEVNAGSGSTIGLYGKSDSGSGRGVYGLAPSTTGVTFGVYGESDSSTGRAVYGTATAAAVGDDAYGVRGVANSIITNGYGVYAVGDMGASGVKPFRIDHPCDPANKYLLHYSSESPAPQNFYSGNVVTDGNGYAWVDLPDYFGEINTNFKYQLTVVDDGDAGQFVQAKVSQKIRANRFQIRTSAPNVEVSWRVEADRNDLYVRFKQPKDVQQKAIVEKGKYQHPELYGQSPESGMDYHPPQDRQSRSAGHSPTRK